MSNINAKLTKEKPMAERLAEKRHGQLESDSAMTKTAPEATPGAIQTHPMEPAMGTMSNTKKVMEQCRHVLQMQYDAIDEALKTGDFSKFLDDNLGNDPETWEMKLREYTSLQKKLITILPLKG
jgi:hypothetical protein